MGIFQEIPNTAGFPIHFKDIFLALNRREGLLEEDFKRYLGRDYARITCSGTAAFYFILETLKKLSDKKTVIIPAFICPLVPLAINQAGLKIKVVDTSGNSFDYDPAGLKAACANETDILAVLSAHLGGIPSDLSIVSEAIKNKGIFLVEDCAQSLGAEYKGRKAGLFGDFAFYSLCRGKGLTIYEGGVAVAKNNEFAKSLDRSISSLENRGFFSEALKTWELLGYWLFYRPSLYWFVFRLPQAYWNLRKNSVRANGDYFGRELPRHRVSGFRKSIGHVTFNRLEEQIAKQRAKADYYITSLKNIPGIKTITEPAGSKATYPFITIVFDDLSLRQRKLKELEKSGLGCAIIYLNAITDYAYLKDIVPETACPNAKTLARSHLSLSTSIFMDKKSIDRVLELLQ